MAIVRISINVGRRTIPATFDTFPFEVFATHLIKVYENSLATKGNMLHRRKHIKVESFTSLFVCLVREYVKEKFSVFHLDKSNRLSKFLYNYKKKEKIKSFLNK